MTISKNTEDGFFLFQPEGNIRDQLNTLSHEDQLAVKNHYADLIGSYICDLDVMCTGEEIDFILRRARGEKEEPFDKELEDELYSRAASQPIAANRVFTPLPDPTQSDYQLQ